QRRMEESEASPVRFEAAAQVRPAVNLMHGLVGHKLFQRESRSVPGDSLHAQKAAVEPGPEKMLQIGVARLEIRAIAGGFEQMPSESHQRLRPMRGCVDAAQHLLTRGFHGSGKGRK